MVRLTGEQARRALSESGYAEEMGRTPPDRERFPSLRAKTESTPGTDARPAPQDCTVVDRFAHADGSRECRPVADDVITTRAATHGDFNETGMIAQEMKRQARLGRCWKSMTDVQREAAEMIATKLARIVCGNPHHPDHWEDIAGYARLALGEQQ